MISRSRLYVSLLFVLGLVLSQSSHAVPKVFACEPEWAALAMELARELGGKQLEVFSATAAMQDPHHIQARPGLIAKARSADLLICSGAGLEAGWLPLLLRKAGNRKIQSDKGQFYAADYVDMLDVPAELDRSQGDVHAEGNPHVHTSPENILKIAAALTQRLVELDAGNADQYKSGHKEFSENWSASMEQWKQQSESLSGLNVITHHRYWTYMNHWLGLKLVATLEPLPGVSPSSSHLAEVSKIAGQKSVSLIMHVAYVNDRPVRWLADKTGLPVVSLPATVDFQGGETLQQWFSKVISGINAGYSAGLKKP